MRNFALLIAAFCVAATSPARAYEQAYAPASAEAIEVFVVPATRWLSTAAEGRYFERSGELFGRLFEYISANDIAMTVPVEGRLDAAEMRFFVDPAVASATSSQLVDVVSTSARRVARLGGKGSYSEENIAAVRAKVEAWIAANPKWQASGPAYAVFWNGPLTPWFLKRFEVHIAIAPALEVSARAADVRTDGRDTSL